MLLLLDLEGASSAGFTEGRLWKPGSLSSVGFTEGRLWNSWMDASCRALVRAERSLLCRAVTATRLCVLRDCAMLPCGVQSCTVLDAVVLPCAALRAMCCPVLHYIAVCYHVSSMLCCTELCGARFSVCSVLYCTALVVRCTDWDDSLTLHKLANTCKHMGTSS